MATDVGTLAVQLGLVWNKPAEAKANAKLSGFAKTTQSKMGRLASTIASRLAPLAGITAAVFAGRDAMRFSESLARLDITAKGGLGTMDELQAKILKVSSATGVAKEGVAQVTSKFVELTGDVPTAAAQMELFAKVMQATGATADDVAGSAAALSEQFGIGAESFEKMFSIAIEGGKAGSAEFKDMAQHLAGIGAASQKFANSKGVRSAAELGTALQIVSGTTGGNVAEATTQIKSMFTGLGQASDKLKKHGVRVFDTSGEYRELSHIFEELRSKGLSPKQLEEIFPNVRAQRGVAALLSKDWQKLTDDMMDSNAVSEDLAKINENSAVKLAKAWNKVKNVLTKVFVVLVDTMAWIVDNSLPITIAIASIAGAIAIYKAAVIGAAIKTAWLGRTALLTWAKMLAPIIVIALLIAAAILIIQDLWVAFTGGESVLKDLHGWAVDSVVDWMEEYSGFFDWLIAKIQWAGEQMEKVTDPLGKFGESLVESGETDFKKQFAGAEKKQGLGFATRQLQAQQQARAAADVSGVEARGLSVPKTGTGAVSTSLVVNVESGANVDDSTVTKIVDQTQAAMKRTSRQLASETQ